MGEDVGARGLGVTLWGEGGDGEEMRRQGYTKMKERHFERFLHRFSGLCVSACFDCATLLGSW